MPYVYTGNALSLHPSTCVLWVESPLGWNVRLTIAQDAEIAAKRSLNHIDPSWDMDSDLFRFPRPWEGESEDPYETIVQRYKAQFKEVNETMRYRM